MDAQVNTTVNPRGQYFEAGAVVLNRKTMTAYSGLSERAHKEAALLWQKATGYDLVLFDTNDFDQHRLHHTSHLLFIGTGTYLTFLPLIITESFPIKGYALVAPDLIIESDRKRVLDRLLSDGLTLIELASEQVFNFVSHAAEIPLEGNQHALLLSTTAFTSLKPNQVEQLKQFVVDIQHVDLSTLELLGGGSVVSIINQLF